MNNISQYIFNLYHYLVNLRDTMEYTIEREHKDTLYNQRKSVLTRGISDGFAFGNFLKNNGEKGEEIKKKLETFIDDVYGNDSTILILSGDNVRVDHTQHIQIFDYVVGLSETVRDIIISYMNHARGNNELEKEVVELMNADDRFTRCLTTFLLLKEYEKSFAEFQKVMNESKGKQTPQSNFIVQNELNKLAALIRFNRAHAHIIDNETLDMLDRAIQLIEMCEGRRERRDGKPFNDLFQASKKELGEALAKNEAIVKPLMENVFRALVSIVQDKSKQA